MKKTINNGQEKALKKENVKDDQKEEAKRNDFENLDFFFDREYTKIKKGGFF